MQKKKSYMRWFFSMLNMVIPFFTLFFSFLWSKCLMTPPKIVSDSKSTHSESITIAHKENNIPPPTSFMSNITNKSSCFDWRQSRSEAQIAKAHFSLTYQCAINQTRSARYLADSFLLLIVHIVCGVCSDCPLFPQILAPNIITRTHRTVLKLLASW